MKDQIIQAILAIVSVVFTGVLVPYIKSRTSESTQNRIKFWMSHAISEAQVIFSDPNDGAKRKIYVNQFIQDKFKLNQVEIDMIRRSLVSDLKANQLITVDPSNPIITSNEPIISSEVKSDNLPSDNPEGGN